MNNRAEQVLPGNDGGRAGRGKSGEQERELAQTMYTTYEQM
jgi:hypothetical protein